MPRQYFVYIMASHSRVLYIGVTNSVTTRTAQHKDRKSESFTAKHRCTRLVLYEVYPSPLTAIAREKQLKGWTHAKKIALIEQSNPTWRDLSEDWDRPPAENVMLTRSGDNEKCQSDRSGQTRMSC